MLLLVALTRAFAADGAEAVVAGHPGHVHLEGDGDAFRLVDAGGDRLSTGDALRLLGAEDSARAYHAIPHGLGYGLMGASIPFAILGSQTLRFGAAPDGLADPTTVAVVSLGSAALLLGGGAVLAFVQPKPHLGDWMDRATAQASVDRYNAAADRASAAAVDAEARARLTRAQLAVENAAVAGRLTVAADGEVYDGAGERVTAAELAHRLQDSALATRIAEKQRESATIWPGVAVGGGVVAGIGLVASAVGCVNHWGADESGDVASEHESDTLIEGGLVTVLGGLSLVGAGVGGGVVARAWQSHPAYWLDDATLRTRVDAYDAALLLPPAEPASTAAPETAPETAPAAPAPPDEAPSPGATASPPPGTARLRVQPLVGPIVGVTGTF